MLKRLAVMACLLLAGPAWSNPAWADPAVWVARGPRATVYLLGSVHMLRAGTAWDGPAVKRAFDAAQECWFEVVLPDDPAAMQGMVMSTGLDPARKLSDLLPEDRRAQLDSAAERSGMGPAIQIMRPWLASLVLVVQPLQAAGYDPALGVDTVLQVRAKATGKHVGGVETLDAQFHMLSDLPEALAVKMLLATLDDLAQGPSYIDAVIQAWQAGDIGAMAEAATGRVRKEAPELYQIVFTDRNETFARAVQGFLDGDKTVLLVVGAGHLAGPDNVLELLERRGVMVERVAE